MAKWKIKKKLWVSGWEGGPGLFILPKVVFKLILENLESTDPQFGPEGAHKYLLKWTGLKDTLISKRVKQTKRYS